MKKQLEQRLEELKTEFENGQKMLAEVEIQRANLQESMLRISGAIQVMEEEIAKLGQASGSDEKEGLKERPKKETKPQK